MWSCSRSDLYIETNVRDHYYLLQYFSIPKYLAHVLGVLQFVSLEVISTTAGYMISELVGCE